MTTPLFASKLKAELLVEAQAAAQAWSEGTLPGGAGTKSAKEWAGEAEDFAQDAAQSAAYAGGFETPEYASQSAGNAATAPGQIFRVPLGTTPQTFNWYRRLASGSELVDPLATRGALAASGGAELVGFIASGAGATARTVQAKLRETLSVKDFGAVGDGVADDRPALLLAIDAASAAEKRLIWPEGTYRITSPLEATGIKMLWDCRNAKVLFDSASDVFTAFSIVLADAFDHQIIGLELDAGGSANGGIRFTQPLGTSTATLTMCNVVARNIEKNTTQEGASGIQVRGGFGRVTMIEPEAHNLMMRAGTAVPGSSGVIGIVVINNPEVSGAYCRDLNMVRPKVRRVYSQTATDQFDMDGIGIFANPDVVGGSSFARIEGADIAGCWGRDIKSQFARTHVISPKSVLDEGPTGGIVNATYDFQSGPAIITGINATIDGVSSLYLVRFSTSADVADCSHLLDGGSVALVNLGTLRSITLHDNDTALTAKMVSRTKGVTVNGTAREAVFVRTNGADKDFAFVEGVVGTFSEALVRVESSGGGSSPYRAFVGAESCVNIGSAVAMLRMNVSGQAAHAFGSQKNLFGFTDVESYYTWTAATQTPGELIGARLAQPMSSPVSTGGDRLYGYEIANNGEVLLPEVGLDASCIVTIKASTNDRNGYATLAFDTGGFTNISVGTSFNIGTISDPGSGSYRVWRDGNRIRLKNAQGSTRYFTVWMLYA